MKNTVTRPAILRATAATAALGSGPALSATVTRRALIRNAGIVAGGAALSLPAIAAARAPDPLIALGKAERAAYRKFCAANLALDRTFATSPTLLDGDPIFRTN